MMHLIWTSARSVFAVLAGIVAVTAVAFAVEIPVRSLTLRLLSQSFPDPSALDSHIGWHVNLKRAESVPGGQQRKVRLPSPHRTRHNDS